MPYRVENIVRNGGLNCLLQASFPLVHQNAALYGKRLPLNNILLKINKNSFSRVKTESCLWKIPAIIIAIFRTNIGIIPVM